MNTMNIPPLSLMLTALALFAVACAGGSLSLFLNGAHDSSWLHYANLVAAGVLMGVSVFHMLPDALDSCSTGQALGVYALGFIVVSLLDKVLSHEHEHHQEGSEETQPQRQDEEEAIVNEKSPLLNKAMKRETSFETDTSSTVSCVSCQQGDHEDALLSEDGEEDEAVQVAFSEQERYQTSKHTTVASAWSLWLALSVHSLLEGASLGAQPDRLDLALGLFLHKGLVAFSVTTSWRYAYAKNQYLWMGLCLSFAAMTPIGVLLGWTLMKEHQEGTTDGIVAALAGGTFLYVGVGELLLPAWKKSSGGVLAVLAVAAGLGLVAVFAG